MIEPQNRRVLFEGRDCDVVRAYLYAGDYYDLWLQDVKTQKFTDVCTVTDRTLPVGDRQRLVREAYVGVLAQAGFVTPTGKMIGSAKYGKLYRCEVPERDHVPFWKQSRENDSSLASGERECDMGDDIEL